MDWQYLAGFFDGEGNFHINIIKRTAQLKIRIYSTNRQILEDIKNFVGVGNIYDKGYRLKKYPTQNIIFEFVVGKKQDCLNFLNQIYPHLVLKKEQAKYLLDHYDFTSGTGTKNHANTTFGIDEFRSLHNRAGANRFTKHHTITPFTE